MAGADEEFVLPATVAYHIKATVLQLGSVLRHSFPRGGNPDGGKVLDDIRRSGRMLLIRVIPQVRINLSYAI